MADDQRAAKLRKDAWMAMRQHIQMLGGLGPFRDIHCFDENTARRILLGDEIPVSLCSEIAGMIRRDPIASVDDHRRADALAAYAEREAG